MMKKEAMCIMLVDDNKDDNFFHEREIKKANLETAVIVKESGTDALEYLHSMIETSNTKPTLIFLDINMPGMNGWEFLDEYSKLDKIIQSGMIIVMLTTSDNPETQARAMSWSSVSEYITKPLTKERMKDVNDKYFKS
ncbi:MAG: response regulator [Candidatus Delongbacteria bacterium]|nr:response regulator [Candidatus Delongbacteria bacterium]